MKNLSLRCTGKVVVTQHSSKVSQKLGMGSRAEFAGNPLFEATEELTQEPLQRLGMRLRELIPLDLYLSQTRKRLKPSRLRDYQPTLVLESLVTCSPPCASILNHIQLSRREHPI
jgi:hypothetical protein